MMTPIRNIRTAAWIACLALAAGCSSGGDDSVLREEEPNDTPATALDLGVLGSAVVAGRTGRVAAGPVARGDLDYVRFVTPAHGRLIARLDLPGGADYDLALFDSAGRRAATSRADNRDPDVGPVEFLLAFVAAGEVCFLEVGGFAGEVGDYLLSLRFVADALPGSPDPVSATTQTAGPLQMPRSFHAVAVLPDGQVLIAGGTSDPSSQVDAVLSAINTTELFDPATGGTVAGPQLSAARFGLTATVLPTGRVLLAGGDLEASADLYDPLRNAFVARRIPMAGGIRVLPTATLLADGRLLLAGGTTILFNPLPAAQTLDSTTIYDPKTRTFAEGPVMQAARVSHAAVRVADGRVLLTGGPGLADSEWIDATATSTQPGPSMTGVRDDHSATLLADGRVVLVGGQDGTGRSRDDAEVLEGGAFRRIGSSMRSRRADHQALRLPSGHVLILGGEDDPGGGPDLILDSVEFFDPGTEAFVAMPPLGAPRDDHRVVRLFDGRILVTGGEDADSESVAAVEVYSPR